MIIITDDDLCPKESDCHICWSAESMGTEITSDEWDVIYNGFSNWVDTQFIGGTAHFAQYLKELIELRRIK